MKDTYYCAREALSALQHVRLDIMVVNKGHTCLKCTTLLGRRIFSAFGASSLLAVDITSKSDKASRSLQIRKLHTHIHSEKLMQLRLRQPHFQYFQQGLFLIWFIYHHLHNKCCLCNYQWYKYDWSQSILLKSASCFGYVQLHYYVLFKPVQLHMFQWHIDFAKLHGLISRMY